MPWFEYMALTSGGTAMAGRFEAAAHEEAAKQLAEMGLEVRELNQAEAPPRVKAAVSAEDLIFFNEQLASLAEAGIALDEGLAQLARDVQSPKLRRWIEGLVEDVCRGAPLDQAVAAREKELPILYSRVIRAGIEAGRLPATLLNLNHHLRLMGSTRRIIWETASYPLLVAVLALVVVSVFFVYVVPQFKDIFVDFDASLPGLTVLLIELSDHYAALALAAALVVILIASAWRLLRRSPRGRSIRDQIMGVLPVVGRIHCASLVARFLRAVSTAVASGIPLPQALRLGAGATGSDLMIADAEMLASEVEAGESIFVASQSARAIPPLFGFCVQAAGGRDALPQAIDKLACAYESRAIHTQSMLRVVLFPLMIIFLGGLLGLCILGVFLPLVSLINAMTG